MAHDDWSGWGELWQQQPAPDMVRLHRLARRKRRRMQLFASLEMLVTLVALWQLLRTFGHFEPRWKIWSVFSLGLVLGLQALFLHIRRGTWNASGSDLASALRLAAERARAGIRLAQVNIWSTVLLLVATALAAAPELDPSRWRSDPHLRLEILVQIGVNGPIVALIIGACLWYMRRQRRRIRDLETLTGSYLE
jgi:hypothetical protein